jgi:hypothetical protein
MGPETYAKSDRNSRCQTDKNVQHKGSKETVFVTRGSWRGCYVVTKLRYHGIKRVLPSGMECRVFKGDFSEM